MTAAVDKDRRRGVGVQLGVMRPAIKMAPKPAADRAPQLWKVENRTVERFGQ